MATREGFDCSPVLQKYSALVEAVGNRYGPDSQAVVFILYEELIALRSLLVLYASDARLQNRVGELRRELQRLYTLSAPEIGGATPWRRIVEDDSSLIEYDRRHFELRYRSVCAQVLAESVRATDGRMVFEHLQPRQSYMFVIDDRRDLLIWSRAFELQDLAFGRNKATVGRVPVAHPMLVPDRLRVAAAGEIVLIGGTRVEMVVANTKSGHFRPPPESAHVVREVCQHIFGIADSRIDVFTLFESTAAGKSSIGTTQDSRGEGGVSHEYGQGN